MACIWHHKNSPVLLVIGLLSVPRFSFPCHCADHHGNEQLLEVYCTALFFSKALGKHAPCSLGGDCVRILKQQQGREHKVQAKGEENKNVSENLKSAQFKICQNKAQA